MPKWKNCCPGGGLAFSRLTTGLGQRTYQLTGCLMNLDPIQRASQEQFARQSRHYGQGHILENVADLQAAQKHLQIPCPAQTLDVATGGGHTGLFFAALGHDVTVSDLAEPMLARTAEAAVSRGLRVRT